MGCLAMVQPTDGKKWNRNAWIDAVWDDERVNDSDILVAEALKKHCSTSPVCWPSQRRLADKTRKRRNTVKAAIDRLEKFGFLTSKWISEGPGKGHYEYTLKMPAPVRSIDPGSNEAPGSNEDCAPGSNEAQTPGQMRHKNPSIEPLHKKQQQPAVAQEFKNFDGWVTEQVEKAGRPPLPFGTVQTLVMRLLSYGRPAAEAYVLEALGNMADLDDGAFRRAIIKPQNVERYIRPPAPDFGATRTMTADEWDRLEFGDE